MSATKPLVSVSLHDTSPTLTREVLALKEQPGVEDRELLCTDVQGSVAPVIPYR